MPGFRHHLGRGPFDPRLLGELTALARERSARILHVHGYAAADYGRLVARRIGAKLVLPEHFATRGCGVPTAGRSRPAFVTDRAVAVSGPPPRSSCARGSPRDRVRLVWTERHSTSSSRRAAPSVPTTRAHHRIPVDARL